MNYGLWTPFIDEPRLFDWYQLPEPAAADCAGYIPNGHELDALSPEQFRAVHTDFTTYANRSVRRLPYHNPTHFKQVERAGMSAAYATERLSGNWFPQAVLQHLRLALRMHDCHHPGSTFRADARHPQALYQPKLGVRIAVEWASAGAAWELARQHNLPVPARLFQTQVIWSSTFGGHTERGAGYGVPDVQPTSLWGCIMRAADVCPQESFTEWMANSVAINYGEVPAVPAPATWAGFLESQLAFTGYIEHCFDRLDDTAGVPVAAELGWRRRLLGHQAILLAIAGGGALAQAATIRGLLAQHGVTLS